MRTCTPDLDRRLLTAPMIAVHTRVVTTKPVPVPKADGTHHVRMKAYSTFSGVSLTGSFTAGSGGGGGGGTLPDVNGSETNISVGAGQWQHYTQDLQAGYTAFNVNISGGSGDADLYVKQGSQPTSSNHDCRPYKSGNNESCSFNNPAAGTWHMSLNGYSAASGVNLTWTATKP